ncbi:MAG TPA: hypothetical protein VHK27_08970, partial [Gammaproteobacteria bacterium]|nr:hypothetical protein [Gammaproteobacteria bacterium]
MNPINPTCTEQDSVVSACPAQVLAAANNPYFRQGLLNRERELLPLFALHYIKLKALPRRMRRRLQRQWRSSLPGIALLLALNMTPALAATINVGGQCTLVRAINSANTDTAVGGCTRGRGADRIVLPRNSTQTLTAVNNNNPDYGRTGLPIIRSNMTIVGNNSTIRRSSSAPDFRIFAVARTGNLRLQHTTVSGGVASGGDAGGGVFNTGSLTL